MYALLALNLPKIINTSSVGDEISHSNKSKTRAIAGGLVSGGALLTLVAVGLFYHYRRRARRGTGFKHQAEPYSQNDRAEALPRTLKNMSSTPRTQVDRVLLPRKMLNNVYGRRNGDTKSAGAAESNARSVDKAVELREEVENLRREIEEMRMMDLYDPLPEYGYGVVLLLEWAAASSVYLPRRSVSSDVTSTTSANATLEAEFN
ncbi:hypothetical protein GYMLUDRAFT_55753 [Collybiopsis luxurians FD-317 M1]|nr:hypothetical protein GYMLUDRAFT_55753 [Collybiopsis luxurians FD-317 M1]